ncbi:MAG: hypothetical protein GYB65_04370 [Chloroflexi bacterium]|nr:hypothetical protein [Chloroflexota bacterium]
MQWQDLLTFQVPVWTRPGHPVLRHILQQEKRRRPLLWRAGVRALGLAVGAALVGLSWWAYRHDIPLAVSSVTDSAAFQILYLPLVLFQLYLLVTAFALPVSMFEHEQRFGTWEAVKITSHGAEMTIYARWAATMYQIRWRLAVVMSVRVFFAVQLITSLVRYQGRYLELYSADIAPAVSGAEVMLLLAALVTGILLLPLALISLNIALGLLFPVLLQNRYVLVLAQSGVLAVECLLFMSATLWNLNLQWSAAGHFGAWEDALVISLAGDQGLLLLDGETLFQFWADVPNGVLFGVLLLAIVVVLAAAAQAALWLAAWLAGRPTA